MDKIEQPRRPENATALTSVKYWGTLVLAILGTGMTAYLLSTLLALPRTPVIYFAASLNILSMLVGLAVVVLTLRGYQVWGARLAFYMVLLLFLASPIIYAGRALTASFSLLFIEVIVILQLLPKASRRGYFVVTGVAFLLIWVLEWLNPAWRLQIDAGRVGPATAIIFGFILAFIVIRQAWAGSLRNKLLVAFISVAVVSTGALSVFVIVQTTNSLHDSLERELSALTTNTANRIGDVFDQQINTLNTLSITHVVQQAIEDQNATYQGNAAAIETEIYNKDLQWRQADAANNSADPLVVDRLTNPVSADLRKYQETFPDNVEVFVTDIFGGLVGSTGRTSDYNQADEDWWQAAYNQGAGAIYLSDPQFDLSSGKIGIQFALPVRSARTGQMIGILRTTYLLTPLQSILQVGTGQTGRADIFLSSDPASHIHEGVYGPSTPDLLKQILEVSGQGLVEMNFEGGSSVVVEAPVRSPAGNAAVEKLGWMVVFHQSRDEAFAVVNAQIQGILIVIALVLILAIAAAILLAQFLIGPLVQLTETARQIAAGNLNSQARVVSADEIGLLASAFNSMTTRLREFIDTLEQRVAERTQSLELAGQVGRAVSEVRALEVMLRDAAELIRSSFNLYYVQVYLTDPTGTNLVLQAGTGAVGAELIARGHRLPLNSSSLNGRAAVEKRSVVIADTTTSATFRSNELLPETRSEMAIPLLLGEKVVGVLDLQSREAGGLNPELLTAFEALASQFAIAIQNASLLAEAEQARAEVEAQARRLVRASWSAHLDAIHQPEQMGFVFEKNELQPLSAEGVTQPAPEGALVVPLAITGEAVGNLVVELENPETEGQVAELVRLVARQAAQQLENLRLLDSAERYRVEAEQVARSLIREGWETYLQSRPGEKLRYLYDLNTVRPLDEQPEAEIQPEAANLPLKIREEVIGKLAVQGLAADDKETLEFVTAVAERLSAHIENLRFSEQTQERAQREHALSRITRAVRGSTDPATILRSAARELGALLGRKTILRLKTTTETQSDQPQPSAELAGNDSVVMSGNAASASTDESANADGDNE